MNNLEKETYMGKISWKPGNMLYPVPAVMVSCGRENEKANIITVAWAGTTNTNPAMVSISVRPERYSYDIIRETGEFVINLVTKELVYATDFCGVRSGRDVDKFAEMKLHEAESKEVKAPGIMESPVNIECRVVSEQPLGSHTMFLAKVVNVNVDDRYMDLTSMRRGLWHIRMANILNLGKSSEDSDFRFKNLSRSKRKIQSERMLRSMKKDNVILIGMPGVGKSTVGVVLAKILGYHFIDTDLVIQEKEGRLLKEIIAAEGNDGFLHIEDRINAELEAEHSVIAPGGSVVYGGNAMRHFKEIGTVVYLKASYEMINERLSNLEGRGVVLKEGQTLKDLYDERCILYEKYADFTVDEQGRNLADTARAVASLVRA